MKALQLQEIGKLELIEAPIPSIGDDQLLIKTGAAVICTSDLNDIRENPFNVALPVVMGHEGAGTVAAVGKKVRDFHVGDRVATHPVHPCGTCHNCRSSMGHLCSNMGHFGLNMPGTFGEYYLVRQDRARTVDAGMRFEVAAPAEPVCVCLEALAQAGVRTGGGMAFQAMNTGWKSVPPQTLLIIGDGPFGVLMAKLAAALDLKKTVIAGRHDFRLSFADGAVRLNTKNGADPLEAMRREAPEGYDAVIQAVGIGQAVQQGLALLRPKGRLVIFSAVLSAVPLDLFQVHLKELEIVGACNDQDRFDEAIARLGQKSLGLDKLITHTFPIERYREAFDLAAGARDKAMKVALVFGETV